MNGINMLHLKHFTVAPHIEVYPFLSETLPPATTTNATFLGHLEYDIVDPATTFQEEQTRTDQIIKERLKNGQHLRSILLTHHHFDHVSDADRLRKKFNVPILAHEETAKRVPFSVDKYLIDNDQIVYSDIAMHVTAVFTPGHARGHLCFYEPNSKTLVAGDMVAESSTILIDPSEGDMRTYMDSLERLLTLPLDVVIPAHGDPMQEGRRHLRATLAHRKLRQQQVLSHLPVGKKNAVSAESLVRSIYGDVPEMTVFLATRSTLSSLYLLNEEEKVQANADKTLFWK